MPCAVRPLSQQMFLVFFHENIAANYKLMHNFGKEKLNQSFNEQLSEKYTSIFIEKMYSIQNTKCYQKFVNWCDDIYTY